MDINFSKISVPESGTVVYLVGNDMKLPAGLVDIDKKTGGAVEKAIKSSEFKGKAGSFVSILATVGLELDRVVLAGYGGKGGDEEDDNDEPQKDLTENDIVNLGGKICTHLNSSRVKEAYIAVEDKIDGMNRFDIAANIAFGIKLKSYTFYQYFTKKKDDEKLSLKSTTLMLDNVEQAEKAYETHAAIAEGVYLTRDLVSEPPNVLNPESYAERCKELKSLGIKVEVLGEKEMAKLGMGSLLGVGQGSVFESKMVIMQWNGAPKGADPTPIAFVGKGVTFDTGGISIKPSNGMEDMKYDMGGSGTVVGLMKALAGRKAKVNVVGVVGLVENMPGGNAQRPSDIVTSMSGQTIEVLNTDAEGRLVLADALWYTQDKFKPRFMIDLATLTGAIVVALADQYCGLFSNNDELSERLIKAGEETGQKTWRLPMGKEYDKMIDSKIADVQNIGDGRGAGSITAAQFLERFVNKVPWAHLDIAGMAWADKALDTVPKGASGYGVRLLDKLVADHYES